MPKNTGQTKVLQIRSYLRGYIEISLNIFKHLELNNNLECFIHVGRVLIQELERGGVPLTYKYI